MPRSGEERGGPLEAFGDLPVVDPGPAALAVDHGRAPTFLLATGYEQARSVVAAIAGDWQAARNVQLNLPQTGVCSSNLAYSEPSGLLTIIDDGQTQSGCCN
ncbi:hypothetical protein OHA18_34565 [Kribbella sp. NBC_00709]|uniref:hypothetical protein n=1 Tax=Kribbella sp. NBC_00709 TaxID=2975972 RepID=UPI002E2B612E|nr:hypothetical protein [Kribbella sp. NBC_00709]